MRGLMGVVFMKLDEIKTYLLGNPYGAWNFLQYYDNASKRIPDYQTKIHQILVSDSCFIFSLTFDTHGDCNYRLFNTEYDLEVLMFNAASKTVLDISINGSSTRSISADDYTIVTENNLFDYLGDVII